ANLAGHRRGGCGAGAKQRVHAAFGELGSRRARELLGEKTRVVRHEQRGPRITAQYVFGDGRNRNAHVGKREILGDDAAPARGAKFYGRSRHFVSAAPYCILTPGMGSSKGRSSDAKS